MAVCGLTMHPEKSQVVYCQDSNRRADYPNVSFTFLGFPRMSLVNTTIAITRGRYF